MRRSFATLAESCVRALLVRDDRSFGAPTAGARPAAAPAPTTRRARAATASGRTGRASRASAGLAAAIAAALLLPLAGNGAAVASAAAPPSWAGARQAGPAADGLQHIGLIPGESEARYIMTIQTIGQPPKQAACATRAVSGEIVLAPDGSVVSELSRIVVDQRTLKCQAPLRDQQAQSLLQTAQHPFAEFKVNGTPGIGLPLPVGDAAFQLAGDQTVRGVTRPATYETAATFTPEMMVGRSRTSLPMSSFGIKPPSIGPLLQVADDMIAEVDIKAQLGAPVPAGAPAPAAPAEPAAVPATEGEPGADEAPAADAP